MLIAVVVVGNDRCTVGESGTYKSVSYWSSYDHDTHGHNKIISLRRGIKPRNPQHVIKNCDTCGSNVHTTSDHNEIEWFRKREALQAKKVESFKASKTESSSALRSKTPTKSTKIKQSKRGISINKERYVNDLLRMYDKISSLVNTPIMPPNMLGLDLNGKAVNESQYKGMIGSQMNQTASRSDIQFSTDLPERHQVNIRNPTLVLLREFLAISSAEAEDVAAAGCCANILWMKTKAFENSKVFFSTPTGGIYGEVGVNTFRNAIGVHYLPHSSEYVAPLSIDIVRPWFKIIGYGEAVPATGTLKKSLLPPN
ncbi:hypothetical protein Tco_0772010 [Tanacetum coccineum]|uniref:Uncharacterized protein n=1 Tax=Tanacetum coccineum TaxID=301880 RepID=A0ABQ4ZGR1_9ASTR